MYEDITFKNKLASGELKIECTTKENGTFIVDPKKIATYYADSGTVVFTNGYAKNCRIIESELKH